MQVGNRWPESSISRDMSECENQSVNCRKTISAQCKQRIRRSLPNQNLFNFGQEAEPFVTIERNKFQVWSQIPMIRLRPLWFGQMRRALNHQASVNHKYNSATRRCLKPHPDNYRAVIQPFIDNAQPGELEHRLRAALLHLNRLECEYAIETTTWICEWLDMIDNNHE